MPETAAQAWEKARTFHHSRYTAERIAGERDCSIAACLPARECAATVGGIVETLLALRDQGVLDEVLVVDAASRDGTAEVAARAGADVLQEQQLMPRFGEVRGKG